MIGIDANVLVALAAKEHPSHSHAVAVFERELAADEEFILSPTVAAEFLHAVTDPRRLTPAQAMTDAIAWLRAWTTEVAPLWLAPNQAALELWLKWMSEFQLGGSESSTRNTRPPCTRTAFAACSRTTPTIFAYSKRLISSRSDGRETRQAAQNARLNPPQQNAPLSSKRT